MSEEQIKTIRHMSPRELLELSSSAKALMTSHQVEQLARFRQEWRMREQAPKIGFDTPCGGGLELA